MAGFGKINPDQGKYRARSGNLNILPHLDRKLVTESPLKTPIIFYTDGSCLADDGCGGFSITRWIKHPKTKDTIEVSSSWSYSTDTTISIMELGAALIALRQVEGTQRPIYIYTDSQYVQKGVEEYLAGWVRSGRSSRGEIKNLGLWQEMVDLINRHHVEFRWVKGHSGIKENDRADFLAGNGRALALKESGLAHKVNEDYRMIENEDVPGFIYHNL
ncbi:ribonuclease HI [Vibrio phage vB_VcorM_GR7B]|nr:ribonuclease HI [Vibrio phage vB_VcorM_GR7B]